MREGYDQYFLTDTHTSQHDKDGHVMPIKEHNDRNEYLERQHSRYRWMTKEDIEALNA